MPRFLVHILFLVWYLGAKASFVGIGVSGSVIYLEKQTLPQIIFTPSWLCGWAIGLTILGPLSVKDFGTLPGQIAVAMLAGVFYVGVGVDAFQKWLLKLLKEKR